ncbi:hypothetical protein C8R47DRAFT_1324315 [Mycena vitilis]|nr:hypothetical protein C8R47DRAFT_1324315 [Mycena vitilis]
MDSQNACDSGGPVFSSSLLPTLVQKNKLNLLLRSNLLPPESSDCHSIAASSSIDLARYDTEIDRVQQILARLISERDELQEYSNRWSSVFAPVRRLPTEVLAEMFAWSAPTSLPVLFCDATKETPSDTNDRLAHLHLVDLSQVCLSWHRIVMGTPSLWANIAVDLYPVPTTAKGLEEAAARVSRSLYLSGIHPLTIQVNTHESDTVGLELLAQHCERWRVVDMYVCTSSSACLSRVKGNIPRLERLGLGGFRLKDVGIFETAPKLTHVILNAFGKPPPSLPWGQLLEITYYSSDPQYIRAGVVGDRLAVLARCSNQCEFNIYSLNLSDLALPIPDLVPVHSNIRVLRLAISHRRTADHCRQAIGEIIGTLTLPCLQELHFWSTATNERLFWPRAHFPAFASRSSFGNLIDLFFPVF